MTTTRQFEKMTDEELKKEHDNLRGRCSFHTGWVFAMLQQATKATYDMRTRDSGGNVIVVPSYRSDISVIRKRMTSVEDMLKHVEEHLKDLERLENVWSARWKAQREANEGAE